MRLWAGSVRSRNSLISGGSFPSFLTFKITLPAIHLGLDLVLSTSHFGLKATLTAVIFGRNLQVWRLEKN